ncbi:MAG: RDD family protein [Streptosporangiaceae bacterium]
MAEVVTGEAVVLDLAVARFPSRLLALLIDIAVQIPALIFVAVVVTVSGAGRLNQASAAAIYISGLMLVLVGYPLIFETVSRGKTLGKMALGLRVVSDDGGPERFRQALIRALSAAFIEIWLPPFTVIGLPAGLITSMVSAKGKRLGDVFAGTFVIQERVPRRPELAPAFTMVPPPLAGWAAYLELSRISDQTAAAASSYLRRYYDLRSPAREQLGLQLAATVAAQVSPPPPPGTDPAAYLSAVLAVRRDRELARFRARQPAWPGPPGPAPQAGPAPLSGPAPQAGPGPSGPAPGPRTGTLPLGPDELVTLTKHAAGPGAEPGSGPRDEPDDHGFAAPR